MFRHDLNDLSERLAECSRSEPRGWAGDDGEGTAFIWLRALIGIERRVAAIAKLACRRLQGRWLGG